MEFLTTSQQYKYFVFENDYISEMIKKYGYFSPTEIFFLEKYINENDNIIEIGANIGSHCIPLSKKNSKGKFFCFEPQIDVFKMLVSNITVNNCHNVIPYNYGLSQRNQTIYYNDNSNNTNRGGFQIPSNNTRGEKFLKIRSIDYFDELDNLNNLKMIKIDVEGYECEVVDDLEYLIKKHSPIIFAEYNFQTFHPLQKMIKNMDYDVFYFNTSCNQYDELIGVENSDIRHCDVNIVCFPKKLNFEIPSYLYKVGDESFPRLDKLVLFNNVK